MSEFKKPKVKPRVLKSTKIPLARLKLHIYTENVKYRNNWLALYVIFQSHIQCQYAAVYVTRFAKRGLIHAQFEDSLFIAIC